MQTFVKVGKIQVAQQGEVASHVGVMDAMAVIGGAVEHGAELYALIGAPEPKAEAVLDAPSPPPPPPMRCGKERHSPRMLSAHDVCGAFMACPDVMSLSLGDCQAVAEILNKKMGFL